MLFFIVILFFKATRYNQYFSTYKDKIKFAKISFFCCILIRFISNKHKEY